MIREGIQAVVEGRHLTEAEAIAVMTEIMEGSVFPSPDRGVHRCWRGCRDSQAWQSGRLS